MYNTTHRRNTNHIWAYNSWDSMKRGRNDRCACAHMRNVILDCGFLTL